MSNTKDVTDVKLIVVLLQSISGVSAINPLVAFYVINGGTILHLICKDGILLRREVDL
jgi:hypothetical protein